MLGKLRERKALMGIALNRTARGSGRRIAMRRKSILRTDRMNFALNLAGSLQSTFADCASAPLPTHLADLLHQLDDDRGEVSDRSATVRQAQRKRRAVNPRRR
jgi:hypothetical protein